MSFILWSNGGWLRPKSAFYAAINTGEAARSWTGKETSQIRDQDLYTGVL